MRKAYVAILVTIALFVIGAHGTSMRDRLEIEDRLYALAIAVDLAGWDSSKVAAHITKVPRMRCELEVGIWKDLGAPTGAGGSSPAKPSWQPWAENTTVSATLDGIQAMSFRPITLRHLDTIIMGQSWARASVAQVVYFLARSPETHGTLQMVVTKGQASAIVAVQPKVDRLVGPIVPEMVDTAIASDNLYHTNIEEVLAALQEKRPFFLPDIEAEGSAIALQGLGVFQNGHLTGWLSQAEVRQIAWLTGGVNQATIQYDTPERAPEDAGLRQAFSVTGSHARYRVHDLGGRVRVTIDLWLEGNMVEDAPGALDGDRIRTADRLVSQQVRGEMKAGVRLAEERFGGDILGISDVLQHSHPWIWAKYEAACKRDFFKTVDVRIGVVRAHTRRVGIMG